MRYVSLLYLLLGLLPLTKAQPATITQANQLRLTLDPSRADSQQVHTRLSLGEFYLHKTLDLQPSLDSALTMAQQALTLSRQVGDASGAQQAVFLLGSVFIRQRKPERVERMLSHQSDILRIRLLLELGKSWLHLTQNGDTDWSKARGYFRRAASMSKRLHRWRWYEESQLLVGMSYLLADEWPASKAYLLPVLEARRQAGDRAGELWVLLRWLSCVTPGDYQEKIALAGQALRLARQLGDKPKQVTPLILIGSYYMLNGNQKQAELAANQAALIYRAIGPKPVYQNYLRLRTENDFIHRSNLIDLATPYYLAADIQVQTSNLHQALGYYLKIIAEAEARGLPNDLDYLYFMLGKVYFDWNQCEKSVEYFRQSLAISQQKGEVVINIALINRLVDCLLRQKQVQPALSLLNHVVAQGLSGPYDRETLFRSLGNCYMALKQYKLAEAYYVKALQSMEPMGANEGANGMQYLVRLQLGQFYVTTNQFAKARLQLDWLTGIPYPFPLRYRLELVWLQFKVDSAFGHPTLALRHYQRYKALNDSVFNQTKSQQLAELGIRYETQQKEQQLRLKANDIALLTQQSQTRQTQRNALLGGTLLLIALLGLGYNRYQLKQRSNQLLQAQQEQIHHKNEALQRLLTEKERLLKEIHHRVKNNLQIVMSLLNPQAASLKDQAALSAIQESQHRVQAMALIHQKLYQHEGVARIPMQDYIQEVVAYLQESYELPQLIRFELQVEPVELDVIQAVPLGLIINEAITNAFKYAFPARQGGKVQVQLGELKEGDYELVIADDGVGLPADFEPSQSRSLGLTLIHGFSEQLGGQLQISGQVGVRIRLLFQDEGHSIPISL